jgi:hypothetical protein
MIYKLGRFLQLLGLLILPVAIAGEVANKLELKHSLALSLVGMVVFSAGWLVQQGARPR